MEVKQERNDEEVVKIEPGEPESVVVNPPSDYEILRPVPDSDTPVFVKNFTKNSDGTIEITSEQGVGYTYIIENPEDFEGTEFELGDGEHYIIEEYHGDYDEAAEDGEYETVYIQHVEDSQEETTEVYAIAQEDLIEEHVSETTPEEYNDHDEDIHDIKPVVNDEGNDKNDSEQEEQSPADNENVDENLFVTEPEEQETVDPLEPMEVDDKHDESDPDWTENKKSEKDNIALMYECRMCAKAFKTPSGVKRHITVVHWRNEDNDAENSDALAFSLCPCCGEPSDSAHTLGDIQCKQCDKLFLQETSLERHISIDHPTGDAFECYDCKKSFKSRELLIDHMRVHPFKGIKCEGCSREFTRKFHLDRHIMQTGCTGVPKSVYECRVCKRNFTRKDNLAEHLKVHAGIRIKKKKKKYICEFCTKEFSSAALLNIHVRTHTGERPYGCDLCDRWFPSSGAMKKHRRMHTGERPYTCEQCGKKFSAKETLNRHWKVHTGEKPHQCKYCGKAFIQAAQLRAHVFHHTGETAYTCPHCNRAFTRNLRLTTHIKYMHEGAEPLPCEEPSCSKTFFRKEDVQRHMLTHSGNKPFECKICQKKFVVKSSLRIHEMTHRTEPPVSCEVCRRAFIRQDCLMRHMRSKHRDVLEDILANAEKKRLQQTLLRVVGTNKLQNSVQDTIVWTELTLTESIKELLTLLVDEDCLNEFGHPEAPVDKVLDSVIRRCGHMPASEEDFDYIGKLRENAKLLFTVVIDDDGVKELLDNLTVDEVIVYVLKLARKQANERDEHKQKIVGDELTKFEDGESEAMEENTDRIDEEYEVDNPGNEEEEVD